MFRETGTEKGKEKEKRGQREKSGSELGDER
jgi:hypothetical protein